MRIHETINSVWNKDEYKMVHRPVIVGEIRRWEQFSSPVERVLDMPIKFPGTEYRVPKNLDHFWGSITTCIREENRINPKHDQFYAYLTIDQGWVLPNQTHRTSGYHVDGMQGARINPKVTIEHSYLASNTLPTVFCPQPFYVTDLDEDTHNFFATFEKQALVRNEMVFPDYTIILQDAYCVHRCSRAYKPTYRTFFRLEYSVRIWDRLGNTHNPLFDYNWDMVPRDIPKHLGI